MRLLPSPTAFLLFGNTMIADRASDQQNEETITGRMKTVGFDCGGFKKCRRGAHTNALKAP